jgi:multidrug efflux pump subunit AcrA (membrane-fusion protein)/YHS domain-containing protein
VKISSEKQQAIGVQVGPVERKPFTYTLRVLGRVAADETKTYRLNSAADGWIRDISSATSGTFVQKDQLLASYYSRDLLAAVQVYLGAVIASDRFPESGKEPPGQSALYRANLQLAMNGLRSLGMGDSQIEEMRRTRQIAEYIIVRSPTAGFVLARNVTPGQWFDRGTELYRIADLSRVWIFADIYENEGRYFRPGMKVKVSLPNQDKAFQARVSDVLPQFDPNTRTLKLRLEAENPNYFMRPDMFVDVELPIQLPSAITVPVDAVLDSGLKKTIFVDQGNGIFEPREVETGWRVGGRVEIVKGLEPGERIVVSGNFLIDSESKLEMAAAGMQGTLSKDPVCGLEVSQKRAEKAGRKISYRGKTYYFCSEECKQRFEKNPEHYVKE